MKITNVDLSKHVKWESLEISGDSEFEKLKYFNTLNTIPVGEVFYFSIYCYGFEIKLRVEYKETDLKVAKYPYFLIKAYRFQSQEVFQKIITQQKEIERLINVIQQSLKDGGLNQISEIFAFHFNMTRSLLGLEISMQDRFSKDIRNEGNHLPYFIKFNVLTKIGNSFIDTLFQKREIFLTTSITNLGLCYIKTTITHSYNAVAIEKVGFILLEFFPFNSKVDCYKLIFNSLDLKQYFNENFR